VKTVRRWPLFLIASPAAVAVWSGWVGLGGMCGFGVVHPLPGIVDGFSLNTAITLPIGVESYGAYALGAWLAPGAHEKARKFARRSSIGALILGMTGQVIYHLLAAAHAIRAPWPVVVLVSCLPVVVLGFGAALNHLLRVSDGPESQAVSAVPVLVPEYKPRSGGGSHARTRTSEPSVTTADAEYKFADHLTTGRVPTIRQIRAELKVGQPRATELKAHLQGVLDSNDGQPVPPDLLPDTPTGQLIGAVHGGGFG
jgi:hypothetical protein